MSTVSVDDKARREREYGRAYRETRRYLATREILQLVDFGYTVVQVSEYQFLINDRLYLHPTKKRFHHLSSDCRGRYTVARQCAEKWLKKSDA